MTAADTRARSGGETDRLLSVEEARDRVLAAIRSPLPAEDIEPLDALGRVLAEVVIATTDLPPWDNSAMDGYAIRSADTAGAMDAEPVRLRVVGEARAGAVPAETVEPGTAIRIATGAPVPGGADAVVPVEQTTPIAADGTTGTRGRDAGGPLPDACLVHVPVAVGGSIRPRGDDLRAGAVVLEAGAVVTPAAVALAAGAGVARISVHRRPVFGVLATGDEVRPAGAPAEGATIPDANGPGLAANVRAAGAEILRLGIATDELEDVLGRLRDAIDRGADAVVVSGGVSVGPYDVVKLAFERLGRMELWRVAVQPGKPFAFGTVERPGRPPALLFGLPGNPVSSFVTFELFVRPAIRALAGHRDLVRPTDRAVLRDPVTKSAGRRGFIRVVSERDASGAAVRDGQGRVAVRLAGGQGSHVLSALAAADALAIVPETVASLPAGAEVAIWWLDRS